MTDWAAKVLEGVPRYFNSGEEYVHIDRALAAIARMGAGDGLVERLNCADEYEPLGHDGWEAAAHIAALTAQNREMALDVLASSGQAADAYAAQLAAEAERDALRAQMAENRISEPHDPGDFVGDIFYGHPIKTTMGTHRWTGTDWVALPSEAEALAGLLAGARKEAAALRERVARLEGALKLRDEIAALEKLCDHDCDNEDCVRCFHYPEILEQKRKQLAALTETPADGGKHE